MYILFIKNKKHQNLLNVKFKTKKAMKLADIATNIIDNQNKNINEDTDNQVNDDKLSENDSDIVKHDELSEMVIKI